MLILLRRLFLLAARHSANFVKFALCSRTAASVALSATSQRTKFPHPLTIFWCWEVSLFAIFLVLGTLFLCDFGGETPLLLHSQIFSTKLFCFSEKIVTFTPRISTNPMAHEVFISYSRKDMAVADRICEAFDKAGISYFIDRQGIGGGFEFPEVLANAIIECKVVLYLASHNSYASKFTNAELTFAFNEKSKNSVLPYIIDGSSMPPALRFVFAGVNWRNIKDHPIETTLVVDILNMLGREAKSTEPAPVEPPQPKPTPPRPPRKPINPALLKWVVVAVVALLCLTGACVGISAYVKEQIRVAEEVRIAEEAHMSGKGNNGVYDIGYYYDDGEKQGVVFEVTADGRHGKIVSLNESHKGLQWASDGNEQKRWVQKDFDLNMLDNVRLVEGWHEKYPAFAWCADLGEGWYLPSLDELERFTLDKDIHDAVNSTLKTKGKKLANKGESIQYWSSLEDVVILEPQNMVIAWYVNMYDGSTNYSTKDYDHYVRAVAAF